MNICLFTQEEIDKPLKAADPRAQHIKKILHKGVGDTFAVLVREEDNKVRLSLRSKCHTDVNQMASSLFVISSSCSSQGVSNMVGLEPPRAANLMPSIPNAFP